MCGVSIVFPLSTDIRTHWKLHRRWVFATCFHDSNKPNRSCLLNIFVIVSHRGIPVAVTLHLSSLANTTVDARKCSRSCVLLTRTAASTQVGEFASVTPSWQPMQPIRKLELNDATAVTPIVLTDTGATVYVYAFPQNAAGTTRITLSSCPRGEHRSVEC